MEQTGFWTLYAVSMEVTNMKLAALCAVCAIACCAGCGGSGDGTAATGTGTSTSNSIVGRWTANTIQGPGVAQRSCPASVDVGTKSFACGLNDTQIYGSDGSYRELNGGQQGTWTARGNTLTVVVAGRGTTTYAFSIANDVLTEQQQSAAGPVTITFARD
jgi:hypothetical protein